jgi:hypothetical protein
MPAEVARIGKQFIKIQLKLQLELKIQVQLPYHEFYLVNARDRYEV